MIWKVLAVVFGLGCLALLALFARNGFAPRLNDPRLYGTWMSDRERTLSALSSETPERREKFGTMFGKLKVTYFATSYTTEMDGFVESIPYTVLGIDEHSVVIRDDSPPAPDLAPFGLSSFTKIHFEGGDAYWLTTEIGGFREYFKRVSGSQP